MSIAKSYTIVTPDGNPDSIKIVSEGNWNGEMVVCSRDRYLSLRKNPEYTHLLDRPGVYVLIGKNEESQLPLIYIGEGDPIRDRLSQHELKKDFWDTIFFVTSSNLNFDKVQIQYLESSLVAMAVNAKRAKITNAQSPKLPTISLAAKTTALNFLENILECTHLLGFGFFEIAKSSSEISTKIENVNITGLQQEFSFEVTVRKQRIRAFCRYENGKVIVSKGSEYTSDVSEDCPSGIKTLREELVDLKVIGLSETSGKHEFLVDYEFSSPSTASAIIAGRASNGKQEWKSADGKPLAEYLK